MASMDEILRELREQRRDNREDFRGVHKRLDRAFEVQGEHGERLAILESGSMPARTPRQTRVFGINGNLKVFAGVGVAIGACLLVIIWGALKIAGVL